MAHRDPADPSKVAAAIFSILKGGQKVINFPYLTAVLAKLEEERRRDLWTFWLSIAAIVIAFVALFT